MSSRISDRWNTLSSQGLKALIPYVMPEYPVKDVTVPLLQSLDAAGADLIEIGIPYSDPLADGPTIQHAADVALKNGARIPSILESVRQFRANSATPIVLMGYVNPILRAGLDLFFQSASDAGVDGLIIPDLPPEEALDVKTQARRHGISLVFLIAPTTPDDRIRFIDAESTDFSYCVSVTGVTGGRKFGGGHDLGPFLRKVRSIARKRFVVGFGISEAGQVRDVWDQADGAVVGSALLRSMDSARSVSEAVVSGSAFFATLRPREVPHG